MFKLYFLSRRRRMIVYSRGKLHINNDRPNILQRTMMNYESTTKPIKVTLFITTTQQRRPSGRRLRPHLILSGRRTKKSEGLGRIPGTYLRVAKEICQCQRSGVFGCVASGGNFLLDEDFA